MIGVKNIYIYICENNTGLYREINPRNKHLGCFHTREFRKAFLSREVI